MADRIQNRRDTKARWAEVNPILLEGEHGDVLDDPNLYKVGDGVKRWNELPYRGYNGTIVNVEGIADNIVMSQKGVTDALKKRDDKIVQLEQETSTIQTNVNNQLQAQDVDFQQKAAAEFEKNKNYVDGKSIEIAPASVTPETLSEATKQLINTAGGGSVTNLADDEDLVSICNVLKFKDKAYHPSSFSGLGRKMLRKNIDGVSGKNILTQTMINQPNTIYEIQYDYDLNGATITIQEGVLFEFVGGSFKNGIIETPIRLANVPEYQIFYDCKVKIASGLIKVLWFGAKGDGSNCAIPVQQAIAAMMDGSILQFESVEYTHGDGTNPAYPRNDKNYPTGPYDIGVDWGFKIENLRSVIIDGCNCIIKSHPNNTAIANNRLFDILDCHFVEFKRFTLDGCKDVRNVLGTDLSGYNNQNNLLIVSSTNVQIRNVHSVNSMMDCICVSSDIFKPIDKPVVWAENILIEDCVFDNGYRQGGSIVNAKRVTFQRCKITNTGVGKGTMPKLGLDFEEGYISPHGRGQYDCIVRDCYFEGNVTGGCAFHCGCVSCLAENNVFIDNDLYDIHDSITGGHIYRGNKLYGKSRLTVNTIDCKVTDNTLSRLTTHKNTKVYNNTIVSSKVEGFEGIGIIISNSSEFYNNTIINPYSIDNGVPKAIFFDSYTKEIKKIYGNKIYYTQDMIDYLSGKEDIGYMDIKTWYTLSSNNIIEYTGIPVIDKLWYGSCFCNGDYNNTATKVIEIPGSSVIKLKLNRKTTNCEIKCFANPRTANYTHSSFKNGIREDIKTITSYPIISDIDDENCIYVKSEDHNWRLLEFSSSNSVLIGVETIKLNEIPVHIDFTYRPPSVIPNKYSKFIDLTTSDYFTLEFPLFSDNGKASFEIYTTSAYFNRFVKGVKFEFEDVGLTYKMTTNVFKNKELLFIPYVSSVENNMVSIQIKNPYNLETAIRTYINIVQSGQPIHPDTITITPRDFDDTLDTDKYNYLYTGDRTISSYSQLNAAISKSYTGYGKGAITFITEDNVSVIYDGTNWRYSNGQIAAKIKGATSQRPILTSNDVGFEYYDTTLKKYICWNGTAWVNLNGTALT